MDLPRQHILKIIPTSPFAFDYTFYKPDHFTTNDNVWQEGTRWQALRYMQHALGLKFINKGSIDDPIIMVEVYAKNKLKPHELKKLKAEIVYRYNLNFNLNTFYKYCVKINSPVLNNAIKGLNGMRPGHPSSLYEYLIIGVVLQNATVKRSVQMFTNLLSKYGEKLSYDGKTLFCFWQPGRFEKVSEQNIRELKVGYRAKFIKRIDEAFSDNKVNESKLRNTTLEEQQSFLLNLYGVGPATVWYILFDVFHRLDHFEHISPWEQKIYSKLFFNTDIDSPKSVGEILDYINHFHPYQHLAVHYIWEDLWWEYKKGNNQWLDALIRR